MLSLVSRCSECRRIVQKCLLARQVYIYGTIGSSVHVKISGEGAYLSGDAFADRFRFRGLDKDVPDDEKAGPSNEGVGEAETEGDVRPEEEGPGAVVVASPNRVLAALGVGC